MTTTTCLQTSSCQKYSDRIPKQLQMIPLKQIRCTWLSFQTAMKLSPQLIIQCHRDLCHQLLQLNHFQVSTYLPRVLSTTCIQTSQNGGLILAIPFCSIKDGDGSEANRLKMAFSFLLQVYNTWNVTIINFCYLRITRHTQTNRNTRI